MGKSKDELFDELEAQLSQIGSNLEEMMTYLSGISKASSDVLDERRRQVEVEGFASESDDKYVKGELAAAAACYVLQFCRRLPMGMLVDVTNKIWPFGTEWLKSDLSRRDLVKAAALIIAEIERLDRVAPAPKYVNLVDGKIYKLIADDGDLVSYFLAHGGVTHFLGRSEFEKRFKAITDPAPEANVELQRYAMIFDGEEGWDMYPTPDGEYIKYADIAASQAPSTDVFGWTPPQACDGKEQLAFEAWASDQGYDMHEHPLHYLFMEERTNAARMGWNAALRYVHDQHALATTEGK